MRRAIYQYDGVHTGYTEYRVTPQGMLLPETFASQEDADVGRLDEYEHGKVLMRAWTVFLHIDTARCPDAEPGDVECVAECSSEAAAELMADVVRARIQRARNESPPMKFVAAVPRRSGGGDWGTGATIMEAVERAGWRRNDKDCGNPVLFYCTEDAEVQPLPTGVQLLGKEVFKLGELRLKKGRQHG